MDNLALWNDGWWLENDSAWFLYSDLGALFEYSFEKGSCELISTIPEKEKCNFRKYIKCIRYENDIICLPDLGNSILFYSIKDCIWSEVEIDNSNSRLACRNFYAKGNNLYIFSRGLKKIIELDMKEKKIMGYYRLSEKEDDVLKDAVVAGNIFWIVSAVYPQIYTFNCSNNEVNIYRLPACINDNLQSICYKNNKVWLSGRKKIVYRLDIESNELEIYKNIPSGFGVYNFSDEYSEILDCKVEGYEKPTFSELVPTDKYIWFIPFQTNEILYLSLETNEMRKFNIEDEEETVYSLKNRILDHKYLLEYVKDDRYIGLHSLKNEHILEIDAKTLTYRLLPFMIDDACLEIFSNYLFLDGRKMDKAIFAKMMKGSSRNNVKEKVYSIGKQINTKIMMNE